MMEGALAVGFMVVFAIEGRGDFDIAVVVGVPILWILIHFALTGGVPLLHLLLEVSDADFGEEDEVAHGKRRIYNGIDRL